MRIEEYLYAETDDACATCGIRGQQALTIHHIDEDDSNNAYDNRIVLCYNCHKRYNDDKGITAVQIKDRKRRLVVKTLDNKA